MRKNNVLLSFVLFLLVGCGSKPSLSETPASSFDQNAISVDLGVLSEDNNPGQGQIGVLSKGVFTFEKSMLIGWQYISGNEAVPKAEFYSDGGLKMNYRGTSLKSGIFDTTIMKVKLEGKLNSNQQTGSATKLEVYKIDGSTETLMGEKSFPTGSPSSYSFEVNLPENTNQFVIKLPTNAGYNVNLKTITVS